MQLFALITAIFVSLAGYGTYLRTTFVEPAALPEPVPIVESIPEPLPVATATTTPATTPAVATSSAQQAIAPKPATKKIPVSSVAVGATSAPRKPVMLSIPTGLAAYVLLSGDVELTWDAVVGTGIRYRIYRDSIEIGATKFTFYADADIANPYSHRYAVSAYDDVGNLSGRTALVSPIKKPVAVASTATAPAPATAAPTTPTTPTTPSPTAPTPINGACGSANGKSYSSAPSSGLCSTGSAGSVASGVSSYTWSCGGSNGGASASCSATVAPAAVNGACGSSDGGSFASAPTSGLCSRGSASAVSTGSSYTWSCAGSSGGSSASCSASVSAPASSCGSGGACSAAQVATHASAGDCWVYLSPINKVYNITSYVANGSAQHPGGNVITPYCGQNIYSAFVNGSPGGHRHSNSALNSVLQAYYIGPLQ